nr:porin [uncultured Albidiferax sp.]
MKKSLIALAVLASTGAAMAQSSVTLYGIADVNLQSSKVTNGVRQTALESGGVSGSRWGIKGSEDLGGGLKANFVLEGGFNIDDGTSRTNGSIFDRQSYVGLSGGFGEVQLGNSWSALDDIHGTANAVFDSILSPTAYIQAGYVASPKNQIKYISPSFGGVTGTVAYGLGENKTATSNAKSIFSLNVQYAGGPLYVGYAYQNDKKSDAVVTNGSGLTTKHNLVNATYDLGVAKLLASYRNVKNTDLGDDKENTVQVGVDVPVGASLVLSTGYASAKAETAGVADRKTNGFAVGASYSLSKRTSVYTGLNLSEEKQSGVKTKFNLYAVGIRHAF